MINYLKKNLLLVGCLGLLLSASCKKSQPTTIDPQPEKPQSENKGIQLTIDAKFGSILTDKDGKTLYFFANEVAGTPNCTGGCEVTWPVYYTADVSTNTNLDKTKISEITRADGKKQSAYKGYPLYYYSKDVVKGDVLGDNIGGIWFVAKPDYSIMIANAQLIGNDSKTYTSTYTIGTGNTKYFTDDMGRTLYLYAPDKNKKNTYTKPDLSNNSFWPVFEAELKSLPSVISKDVVVVIDTYGKKQLTYKGWPLYYFGSDTKRGENKGVSMGGPGTVWPILNTETAIAPNL